MSFRLVVLAAWMVFHVAVGRTLAAESAANLFRAGEASLASGDLSGALQQFAGAVRAAPSNQQYVQQYAMLRQVLMMRAGLPEENNPLLWQRNARTLHTFYLNHGLYPDALDVGEQFHARLNNGLSALLLAETHLAMNRTAEAARMLAALPAEQHTVATKALHGLAVARHGEPEEAKKIAGTIQLASDDGPGTVYAVARLYAALSDDERACQLLVRCFEATAPSRLETFKQHTRTSPEFAGLAGKAGFAAALQTASKVSESSCSGGTTCASCPVRSKCPSGAN